MPVFFTFLNTRIRGGHTIKQLPENHQTYLQICMPLVVTTTDLMFKKIFELSWFDKLHVEMVWCSCEGSYDNFCGIHDCRDSGHTIAKLELRMERH